MGITIHYRGRIANLDCVEPFEDRVLELVLRLGGDANIWRSIADNDPERVVRGLIVDLAPGQESFSLLISPEGFLVPLMSIEEAERGEIDEPPYCFVKTQFGPVEGHAAIIELLTLIKADYMPELEVDDESGYWQHRDPQQLAEKLAINGQMIAAMAEAIQQDSLSPEAAEDPGILATRIERIAKKVHRDFRQYPPSPSHDELAFPSARDWKREEAEWDAIDVKNRARQRRMERAIEERMLRGESSGDALRAAMAAEFPSVDEELTKGSSADGIPIKESGDEALETEMWRTSLSDEFEEQESGFGEQHPLLKRATDLLFELGDSNPIGEALSSSAMRQACEICGGLAQALPLPPSYEFDDMERGLCVIQLKRALRGAAFLRGALFNVRPNDSRRKAAKQLRKRVEEIQTDIVALLKEARPLPPE